MTFQAKLTTKLEKFSVNDAVIELKNNIDSDQLNHVVKNLLKQLNKVDDDKLKGQTFDFLVGDRFLRLTVEKHLELYSDDIDAEAILSEKLVEVEYVLSLEAPKPLEAIPHDDWVSCVDANRSHIISGSYDNSIRIFTLNDRKNIVTLDNAHDKPVTKVRWVNLPETSSKNQNDLYFLSCGHDEITRLRRFNSKSLKVEVIFVFSGHNRSVNCVDSFDNLIATGSFDKTLRIWSTSLHDDDNDLEIQEVENSLQEQNKQIKKNKKQKTKSSEKSILKTNRNAIMTLTGHQESITGVKWLDSCNEYQSVASCSIDRSICFWDIEVGECKRKLLSAKPLLGIDFSKENNLILSASCDRHVRIWDARAPDNATAKTVYTSHSAWVSSVAFDPKSSNNFISGGYDNLVKLWDLRSPKACLYDMIGHHNKVLDVNWRNPSYVLSGSADSTLKIFSTNK